MKNNNNKGFVVFAFALSLVYCLLWNTAAAQIRDINQDAPKLTLALSASGTDSFNPTLDEELSSFGARIAAHGSVVVKGEGRYIGLDYAASHQQNFTEQSNIEFDGEQSYTNFRANLFSRLYLSKAFALDTSLSHQKLDQRFGEGLSRFRQNVLVNDTLNTSQLSTTLIYGKETATRFVTFNLRAREDNYSANNDYSNLFDLSQQVAELNMVFRRSATGLAFRFDVTNDNFEQVSRVDSVMYRGLIGVDWRPTGKSTLQALLGKYWRDAEQQNNDSGLTWQVDYISRPREDIELALSSARTSQESALENAVNSVIETYQVSANYQYSSQWSYALESNYRNTEFIAEQAIPDLAEFSVSANANAQIKDHSRLQFQYTLQNVKNDDASIDYIQNEVRLTWSYAF